MAYTSQTARLRSLPQTPRPEHDEPSDIEDALVVDASREPEQFIRARIFASSMLLLVMAGLGYGGYCGYRAFTDSFIAPLSLSPDSEVVLSGKLKLDELGRERAQVAADLQRLETELKTSAHAVQSLRELQSKYQAAVQWMSTMHSHKARFGAAQLSAVNAQGEIAKTMLDGQKALMQKAEVDLNAGLITRMDYAREMQRLAELQRNALETERSRLQGRSTLYELEAADQGLRAKQNAALGPEVLANQEQLVRVELEIQHLESEMHVKSGLRDAALTRFGEVDLLAEQLQSRLLFRAVKNKLDLAFVPYTQLDGVEPNADIYACTWGIFFCKPVGTVSEILEGEVSQPDSWGTPSRGVYAVLSLTDHTATRAKTLRVRPLPLGAQGSNRALKRKAAATPTAAITTR